MAKVVGLTHAEAMMQHALKRLFERHGIAISIGEFKRLSRLCGDGTFPSEGGANKGGTFHQLKVNGVKKIWAVYRPDQEMIVSFFLGEPARLRWMRAHPEQQQQDFAGLAQG